MSDTYTVITIQKDQREPSIWCGGFDSYASARVDVKEAADLGMVYDRPGRFGFRVVPTWDLENAIRLARNGRWNSLHFTWTDNA